MSIIRYLGAKLVSKPELHHFRVLNPGPLSLMQCSGRRGMQHLGLAEGGACDNYAFSWANELLGNAPECAVIEVTLGPFEAEVSGATVVAICGAEVNITINKKAVSNWSSYVLVAGDRIRIAPNNNGLRSYIAVKNGFQTPKQFGFRSEVSKESLFPRIVSAGALLPFEPFLCGEWLNKSMPWRFTPDYKAELVLRVFPSYQHSGFTDTSLQAFTEAEYCITSSCDRMGYRLSGKSIEWQGGGILSEGIAFGSVQIPPDGQPIVLLNDRQTIGGYPKIGCVLREDCHQLAQRQAGQKVRFEFLAAV